MALTLRVTSFQSQALGSQAAKTFGAQGGTIGRRSDNDWVLPDPERFISSCHARIVCRGGTFYVADQSSNGTFINGSPQPIGSGMEQPLNDGDRLQIGEYEISVSVDAQDASSVTGPTGFNMSPGGNFATGSSTPGHTGPTGPQPQGGFGSLDVGGPSGVDPLDFFGDNSQPQRPPAPGAEPDNAGTLEQYFRPPSPEQMPPVPDTGGAGGIPEDWDMTGFSPSENRAPQGGNPYGQPQPPPPMPQGQPPPIPPAPAPQVAPAAPISGDAAGAVAAMLQAAGMDAASARAVSSSPALVQALGTLLGVVVQGMLEVLKARSEIKSQFRVPVTMMRPVENNPLKFSATPAQALQTLLQEQNQAYMGPVDAFAEGFQDIKAHQMAMMAGMRAAFDSMIQRFDPQELMERFEKRLKHGSLLSLPGKGRYWDMYRDLYEEWTQDADLNFQRLFGDEFARAYEEQMRRLTSTRR